MHVFSCHLEVFRRRFTFDVHHMLLSHIGRVGESSSRDPIRSSSFDHVWPTEAISKGRILGRGAISGSDSIEPFWNELPSLVSRLDLPGGHVERGIIDVVVVERISKEVVNSQTVIT